MSNFEDQLVRITQKADFKKWIDELQDDSQVLIIRMDTVNETYVKLSSKYFGNMNLRDSLWMAWRFMSLLDKDISS